MKNELTEFNTGGSHEQNPLGGIPQGMDGNGQVNTVEENETKIKIKGVDYVFSNSISLNEGLIDNYYLPSYIKDKPFSDATKIIEKRFKDRTDNASMSTKDALMERLADAQERARLEMEASEMNITPEELLASKRAEAAQAQAPASPEGGEPLVNNIDVTGAQTVSPEGQQQIPQQRQLEEGGDLEGDGAFAKENLGASVGAIAGGAGSLLAMGVANSKATEKVAPGGAAAKGALAGAGAGAALGPVGAAVGAGLGAGVGFFTTKANNKDLLKDEMEDKASANATERLTAAGRKMGGPLETKDPDMVSNRGTVTRESRAVDSSTSDTLSAIPTGDYKFNLGKYKDVNYFELGNQGKDGSYRVRNTESYPHNIDAMKSSMDELRKLNPNFKLDMEYTNFKKGGYMKPSKGYAYGGPLEKRVNHLNPYGIVIDDNVSGIDINPDLQSEVNMAINNKFWPDGTSGFRDGFGGGGFGGGGATGGWSEPQRPEETRQVNMTPGGLSLPIIGGRVPNQGLIPSPAQGVSLPDTTGPENVDLSPIQSRVGEENVVNNLTNSGDGNPLQTENGKFDWIAAASGAASLAPFIGNLIEGANVNEPEKNRLDRVGRTYIPEFADERKIQNVVDDAFGSTKTALAGATGGDLGAYRANLQGIGVNKAKALGQAFSTIEDINRQERKNLNADYAAAVRENVEKTNLERDLDKQDRAAYDAAKAAYRVAAYEGLGELGKTIFTLNQGKDLSSYSFLTGDKKKPKE